MSFKTPMLHKEQEKLSETAVERTLKKLKAIENIYYVCSNLFTSDIATASHKVLKPFCELTGADYGVILLLKNPGKQIHLEATYGFPEGYMESFNNKYMPNMSSEDIHENWPSVRSMLKRKIVQMKKQVLSAAILATLGVMSTGAMAATVP